MLLRKGFSRALRSIRKSKKLTQEDFSEVSSRTYLSSLERGIKSPTLDKVEALAKVLKVHPATLILLAYTDGKEDSNEALIAGVLSELRALLLENIESDE